MDEMKPMVLPESTEMGGAVEAALMKNDYSKLTADQKVLVYKKVCESVGLNYLTNPFGFYRQKDGSEKMYAQRACADQLRAIHGVSLVDMKEEFREDVFSVIVTMKTKDGRQDIDRGDVFIGGLKGLDLANARMRAMTKAKRRCTLSLCGLGWLDESEVQDSPGLRIVAAVPAPPAPAKPPEDPIDFETLAKPQHILHGGMLEKLKQAFANRCKANGIAGKDLAMQMSEKFGVQNFSELSQGTAEAILTWLTNG